MLFGPVAPRGLPPQNYPLTVLLLDRFERAAQAHEPWALIGKRAVEFFEDKQWSDEDKAILESQGRKPLTFNVIKPLIMLVLGYHRNNRTDTRYLPSNDSAGTEIIGGAITQIVKQQHNANAMRYVDAEVFLDGILSGRGYYNATISFENNDLGEIKYKSADPFSTYIDPDADEYDPNTWGYTVTSRWISLDEIEAFYGNEAASYASAFITGDGYSGLPTGGADSTQEITPARTFGLEQGTGNLFQRMHERLYDYVDTLRRTVRILDFQHAVWAQTKVFVDLETGKRVIIPDWWDHERIATVLSWSEARGNPIKVVNRVMKRLRWTTIIGDLQIWDSWSPYKTYTQIPFFPYFRRGVTKGMVESLFDPQEEVNKRYSSELNIMGRTAAGGWMIPDGSLRPDQEHNLEEYGASPGILVKYKAVEGGAKPEPIDQTQPGRWWEQVGQRNEDKVKQIAGVNDSALGNIDNVQSGRAIEAKQRQTVVGIEPYMDNNRRSQELKGYKTLELLQGFYPEQRQFRILGEDGRLATMMINHPNAQGVIQNDITLGDYTVTVDDTPISASFLQGVFEELMEMKELGMPIPDEHLVDASSYGRKDELKQALAAVPPPPIDPETGQPVNQNQPPPRRSGRIGS